MLAKLSLLGLCASTPWFCDTASIIAAENEAAYSVHQLTFGPRQHFFGYIGHVSTIPWNASGRYIVALRVGPQDHLPGPGDAAEIVLIDTTAVLPSKESNFSTSTMGGCATAASDRIHRGLGLDDG